MSSYQELFTKAFNALMAQGCHSKNGGDCAYRGEGDRKCAIGHLLTDEQMDKYEVMEGFTPQEFHPMLLKELLPNTSRVQAEEFLRDLQNAHDCVPQDNFKEGFRERMHKVAIKWELEL